MRRLVLAAALALLAPPLAAAERLAIAGGDLTEIAFALGEGDRIVGVDSTSVFPPEAQALPRMGYLRRLSPEGVLALSPDRLIAAPDAGPSSALDALRAAGLDILMAPEGERLQDVPAKLRFMGEALDRPAEAEALAARFEADLAEVRARTARLPDRPRVLFLLSVARGAPTAAGAGTSAAQVIEAAGGVLATPGFEGWKPVSTEALLAAAPDVVVMMDGHAARAGGEAGIMALPGLSLTQAAREGRFLTVDGVRLLGFGPRTPAAIADLARMLQPEAAAELGL